MKALKMILYVVLGLVVLILLVGAIAPKNFAVEREVVINKPVDEVFEYLKYLKNQDEWSPWSKLDPDMKQEFRGTDGKVGFIGAWEGNKDVGKGEQEIIKISEGERLDFELRFFEPWESTSDAYLTTEALSDTETRVTWGFSGRMNYPMNIMLLFVNMEKAIGKDYDDGLSNLKILLEG